MSDADKNVRHLQAAKSFAEAAGHAGSRLDIEEAYIFEKCREEGFDALVKISQGDEHGCEDFYYGLRGSPGQIAASFHNEKLDEISKGVEYRSISYIIDLHAPIETQRAYILNGDALFISGTSVAPSLYEAMQATIDVLGKERAIDIAVSQQFHSLRINEEIRTAELAANLN